MRIIRLKTKPKHFNLQLQDKKNFEIRLNDRDFKEGDILCLEEYNKDYTGRFIHVEVMCVVEDYCKNGYVTLGTKKRLDLGAQVIK